MDIAFGLFHAEDGALARSWFKWKTDKLYYPEDAVDEALIRTVQDNLKFLNTQ